MWIIGVIAFTGVFREGAEDGAVHVGPPDPGDDPRGWASALGAVLGLVMAASLGWAIFRGGQHVSLKRSSAVTSVFLLLLAAGMFSTGIGRLEMMGVLPATPTALGYDVLARRSRLRGRIPERPDRLPVAALDARSRRLSPLSDRGRRALFRPAPLDPRSAHTRRRDPAHV
jgi:hypothetical protein